MTGFFRIYQQIVIANISRTLAHRVDFLNSLVSSVMWGIFSVIAILSLTNQSGQVMGWTRVELVLLSFTYAVIVGTFHMLFSRNFTTAGTIIHYGELDRYLLKPVNSLFLLISSELNLAQLGRMVLSAIAGIWIIWQYSLPVTVWSVILFLLLISMGVLVLVTLHIFFIVLLLYQSSLSNIMEVGALLTSSARYPMDSLRLTPIYVSLLFLPMMAGVNIPTRALVGKASAEEVVLFCIGTIGMFLFSVWAWQRSLARYTGASG